MNSSSKIAILLFGTTRGQANICQPAFEKVLLQNLSNSHQCVVFLHAFETSIIHSPRSDELNVMVDTKDWKQFQPDYHTIDCQMQFDSQMNYEPYLTGKWAPEYTKENIINLVRQLSSLKRAYQLLQTFEGYASTYDAVIALRLDVQVIESGRILSTLEKIQNETLFTAKWHRHGGLNDRIAVMGLEAAEVYCSRIDNLHLYKDAGVNSEAILLSEATKNDLELRFFSDRVVRRRATGKVAEPDERMLKNRKKQRQRH